jgi:hypothetical protein
MFHDRGVFVEQGLALGPVGDDRIGLGRQFDVRREAAATGADNAGLPDSVR